MGIFREVGKRVERFKQQAAEASRDEAAYECRECGEPMFTEREQCPHCGSENVQKRSKREGENGQSNDAEQRAEDAEQQADDAEQRTDDARAQAGDEPAERS